MGKITNFEEQGKGFSIFLNQPQITRITLVCFRRRLTLIYAVFLFSHSLRDASRKGWPSHYGKSTQGPQRFPKRARRFAPCARFWCTQPRAFSMRVSATPFYFVHRCVRNASFFLSRAKTLSICDCRLPRLVNVLEPSPATQRDEVNCATRGIIFFKKTLEL